MAAWVERSQRQQRGVTAPPCHETAILVARARAGPRQGGRARLARMERVPVRTPHPSPYAEWLIVLVDVDYT